MKRPFVSLQQQERSLLVTALQDRRWFGDGPPHWAGCETAKQATEKYDRLAALLRRYSDAQSQLEGIRDCISRHRCLSGACPTCMRAAQRFFVQEIADLLAEEFLEQPVSAVSLIVAVSEDLTSPLLGAYERRVRNWLHECGVRYAFGGWDFSFNQPGSKSDKGQWADQLWLLIPNLADEQKTQLRQLSSNPAIYRPLKVMDYDGNLAGIAYALKTDFVRRVSYVQEKKKNGINRVCKNTRAQKLRVRERIELCQFLNDIGLHARLFLAGARLVRSGDSAGIRLIGSARTVRLDKTAV